MRIQDLLNEKVGDQYLYHGSSIWYLTRMVAANELVANHNNKVHTIDKEYNGVSCSRNFDVSWKFAQTFPARSFIPSGGVLVLNRTLLKTKYKILPRNYWSNLTGHSDEDEELIVTNRVSPLDKYLISIVCPERHINNALELWDEKRYFPLTAYQGRASNARNEIMGLLNHPKRVEQRKQSIWH